MLVAYIKKDELQKIKGDFVVFHNVSVQILQNSNQDNLRNERARLTWKTSWT